MRGWCGWVQPVQLKDKLEEFSTWMTNKFYNQLEPEIRPATADVYLRVVRLMLGWRLTHAQVRESVCRRAVLNLLARFTSPCDSLSIRT